MWSSSKVSEEEQTESSSFSTTLFNFSSGNPRIEETRGLMHVFPEESPPSLPIERKPLACVVGVPNHMTYADFCQFCGSFIQHMLEMRIVRMDNMEDRYSVLIRFDEQNSTDAFYTHYNGRRFSSLEVEVCRVVFTIDVQYTGSIEHAQPSNAASTEQPTCPVCLERLDQDTSGILTTICNHSFHCSCISKWADSSCPVCRYCQQQAEKSICFVCQTTENLWICVICGFVGCGRYKGGHAIIHWKETQHCYSLEVETKRVWDYVGDNYVHRLIQSKTDGKLVELNSHCMHADGGCGSCGDNAMREAILNSKVEAIVSEYNELLATQLENQKLYFESLLQQVEQETEGKISVAVQKAVNLKQQKIQSKIDRCNKEKKFLDELNDNLLKNEEIWKAKILEIEEREKKALKLTDDKITGLEKKELGDDEEFLRDIILQQPVTYSGSSLSSSNEMDGSDCSGKKVLNLSTTLSSSSNPRTFILSFDKSKIIPATTLQEGEEEEEARIKSRSCGKSNTNNKRSLELPKVKVSNSTKSSGKKSRSDSQCLDHIMAERKRRLDIAQKFIALSATIPGLKKTDKTTILCEAINYVKLLQERVKELEDPNKKSKESTIILKRSDLCANEDTTSNDTNSDQDCNKSLLDVKARVLGNEVLIEIHCEKENGIELKILNLLKNLHLIVTASSVFPFGNSNLGFTIVAQMGDGYKLTVDDLVKTLRQVPLINMKRS